MMKSAVAAVGLAVELEPFFAEEAKTRKAHGLTAPGRTLTGHCPGSVNRHANEASSQAAAVFGLAGVFPPPSHQALVVKRDSRPIPGASFPAVAAPGRVWHVGDVNQQPAVLGQKDVARLLSVSTRTVRRRAGDLQLDRARINIGSQSIRYSTAALAKLPWYRKLRDG